MAGPFAFWPGQAARLLRQLDVNMPGELVVVARSCVALALVVAVFVCVHSVREKNYVAVAEIPVLLALVVSSPPLVAFAVYFAFWHAGRQTVRLLALHPGAAVTMAANGPRRAWSLLARRAALPTVGAVAMLVALYFIGGGLSAAVLAGLLAVSVPHATVTGWRELTAARSTRRRAVEAVAT